MPHIFNSLTQKRDQYLIIPYSIAAEPNIQVMQIKPILIVKYIPLSVPKVMNRV